MKGLFYKEARCLWQYGKSYILLVAVFFGLAMINSDGQGGYLLWLLYPVFFLGSLPASLLSADEKDGWLVYCEALPLTRRQIVTVKYATSAALTAMITVLVLLVAAICGQAEMLRNSELLPLLPLAGTLAPSLMFPAMFRFGATKGRAVYVTVVIAMAVACAALMVTGDTTERAWPLPLTLGIALAVFAASWALSVRWFEAREL